MLDTGQHLQIHGNAEFDRYTYHVYDYLNFFPFYLGYALSHRVDMPGVEVLDDLGIPLLIDRFPYQASYQSFQLYQRGVRWKTLQHSFQSRFSRSLRQLLDEWTMGFEIGQQRGGTDRTGADREAGRSANSVPGLISPAITITSRTARRIPLLNGWPCSASTPWSGESGRPSKPAPKPAEPFWRWSPITE